MIAATLVAMLVVVRTVPARPGPRWAAFVAVDGVALAFVVIAIAALVVFPAELGLAGLDTAILLALVIVPYGLLAVVVLAGIVLLPLRAARRGQAGEGSCPVVRR